MYEYLKRQKDCPCWRYNLRWMNDIIELTNCYYLRIMSKSTIVVVSYPIPVCILQCCSITSFFIIIYFVREIKKTS